MPDQARLICADSKAGVGEAGGGPAGALPSDDRISRLATVAKALSDPIRLRMLALMVGGRGCCGLPEASSRGVPGTPEPVGVCVCEFQEQLGLAQSKTSYHLRVLKDAGLVREDDRGKWSFYEVDKAIATEMVARLTELLAVSAEPAVSGLEGAADSEDPS